MGGNLGKVASTFESVLEAVSTFAEISKISHIYETEAWGMEDAPPFLNQAVSILTRLSPNELLANLQKIETKYGRSRGNSVGYQSRTLDVDILFFGNQIVENETLKIPHPRLHLRNFALVPAAEIEPQWKHPLLKSDLAELREKSDDPLAVCKLPEK